MRLGRIEIKLHLRPRDWTVEVWQWPHQDFVRRYRVKRDLLGLQVGPLELCFWLIKPGQYAIVPEDATDGTRSTE